MSRTAIQRITALRKAIVAATTGMAQTYPESMVPVYSALMDALRDDAEMHVRADESGLDPYEIPGHYDLRDRAHAESEATLLAVRKIVTRAKDAIRAGEPHVALQELMLGPATVWEDNADDVPQEVRFD